MGSPIASRTLLRVISTIVPHSCRARWLGHWDANLAGWKVLRDRGEVMGQDFCGIPTLYRDCVRDALALRMRSDAARAFLDGPGFVLSAGAAILILAAVFTHGLRGARSLFDPLPVREPATIVSIDFPSRPSERAAMLTHLIPLWREKSALARDVAGYRYSYGGSRAWVTWSFFDLLGARPAAGRLFQSGDHDSALLSYPAWRSLYRSNPRILGSTILVEGQTYTVVGILPESFWALSPAINVWVPLDPETQPPRPGFLTGAVARLRSNAGAGQLGKELAGLAKAANLGPPRPVRIMSFANRLPGRGFDLYLVGMLFSIISGIVLVAREQLRLTGHRWRYWLFLAAKTLLAVAIPLLLWMELDTAVRTFQPALGVGGMIARIAAAWGFVVSCVRGLWWSFADQRRRCPVCLRRLAIPVTVGSPASVFEPALTELVCQNGHGALSLPENETDRPDRWVALDSSWDGLFKNKSA